MLCANRQSSKADARPMLGEAQWTVQVGGAAGISGLRGDRQLLAVSGLPSMDSFRPIVVILLEGQTGACYRISIRRVA